MKVYSTENRVRSVTTMKRQHKSPLREENLKRNKKKSIREDQGPRKKVVAVQGIINAQFFDHIN